MTNISVIQEFRDKPSKVDDQKNVSICQHESCTTKLSIYNFTSYCFLHERIHTSIKNFL
jgi:hypothetical protein